MDQNKKQVRFKSIDQSMLQKITVNENAENNAAFVCLISLIDAT